MYENKVGCNTILSTLKETCKKETLYNTSEFIELERNLMGIVDEDDLSPEILGSPSTIDSTSLFPCVPNNEKEQLSLVDNNKMINSKFCISSILRENWADYAARFKFSVFDSILRENRVIEKMCSVNLRKSHSSNNSPFIPSLDTNKQLINHLKKTRHLYELN